MKQHKTFMRIVRSGLMILSALAILFVSCGCDLLEGDLTSSSNSTHSASQGSANISGKPSATIPTNPSTEATASATEQTVPPTEETVPPTEETVPPTEETVPETEPAEEVLPELNGTLNQNVVTLANALLGKAYESGGSGPDTFDASGLIYYCFAQCDVSVGRIFSEQFAHGTEVSQENLQPGDVVFFYQENEGQPEYAGIYIGDGNFIAVGFSNQVVEVKNMVWNSYYAERYIGARRYSN